MNPACKKSLNGTADAHTEASAAPTLDYQIATEAAKLPAVAERTLPPALELILPEPDKHAAEVAEDRVGKIKEESPNKEIRWALLGATVTVLLITLAQILSDLIRATPAYNALRRWFSEANLSGLQETVRAFGRILIELAKSYS
jgi:hypothetical protein